MTLGDNLRAVFRLVNSTSTVTDPPTPDELNDMTEALNIMLSGSGLTIHATTRDSLALIAGVGSRTIGTGGQLDTDRPTEILDAYLVDSSGYSYTMDPMSAGEYNGISSKSTAGRPTRYFYHPSYPTGTLYFDYVSDAAYTLHLDSLKNMAEFSNLTATISLPREQLAYIKWNLAIEVAREFGAQVTPDMVERAKETKAVVERLAAASRIESIKLNVFGSRRGGGGDTIFSF